MRKSWPSLNLKFIVSEKSGKKEELGSYVCWSTKLQAMLEYWWELTKRTNVSWITMSSKKTSSVNWSSLKQVIIAGLGLPKIFLTRSLKLKSFVQNSLLNKNTSVLKWSSTRLPKSMQRLRLKANKSKQKLKPNKSKQKLNPKRPNDWSFIGITSLICFTYKSIDQKWAVHIVSNLWACNKK